MSQGKNWCFTLNNPVQSDHEDLAVVDCKYLIYGDELAPSTGTPHLQGYIVFKTNKRLAAVKAVMPPRIHLELARGSTEQNVQYCTKDGWITERGERPQSKLQVGSLNAQRFKDAFSAAKEGRLEDIPEDIRMRYYATIKQIAKDHMTKPAELLSVCGLWIYGASGTGKTHAVVRAYPDRYIKPLNKWWDGYQAEKVVHLDELAPSHASWIAPYLKKWADKWPFDAETKGGAAQLRPQQVIVTSNYSISQMGFCEEDRLAIERRFKQVNKIRDQALIL